ncbi:MAG: glycosyltransferase family 39 protein, partial [Anaerolineae bacterium]|nr:glycosyltransferase family 39 protein [Anaerolineae bacterium]
MAEHPVSEDLIYEPDPVEPHAASLLLPEEANAGDTARPRLTRRIDRGTLLVIALLALIIGVGAAFRFLGQNWDDFTHLHPDERFLTDVVSRLAPVSGLGEYFDTHTSSLNPNNRGFGFYVYGTLPLFVVKAAAGITAQIANDPNWAGYNGAHLVGRSVSALADLTTLLFIFLIGRRLYGRWVGVLAATLYAFAVLPIQLSHFWTTDAFTSLPVVVAAWFAVRVLDDGGWLNYTGFGVALGAAVASRINVAPLAVLVALAALVRLLPTFQRGFSTRQRARLWRLEGGGGLLAAVVSVVVFRVLMPYAFDGPSIFGILPNADWLSQMGEVQGQVSGHADFPPNHQWASRLPYVFPWWNMVMWGMGLPLGLMAWASWAWAGWQVLRARPNWARHLLPVVWILIYFGWQGRQWVMTMRYYMPLYPFLALLAAWGLATLLRRAWRAWQARQTTRGALRMVFAAMLVVIIVGFTFVWAFAFTRIYTRQLTRVQASH